MLVSVDGRIGYIWTTSDAKFDLTQDLGPAFGASGDFSGGSTIAEAGISAAMPLTPTLQLRAGYRVIWMSDMPTALGSVANTDLFAETIASSSEEVIIHGGTVGLVVGATAPDELTAVRRIAPGLAFLVPGVGAQGGDVDRVLAAGPASTHPAGGRPGGGLVVNVSRGIARGALHLPAAGTRSGPDDLSERVAAAARDWAARLPVVR